MPATRLITQPARNLGNLFLKAQLAEIVKAFLRYVQSYV